MRVERDLHVHEPVTGPMQIDTLRGGVGGEQHPHFGLSRVVVELSDDPLALLGVEASVEHLDASSGVRPADTRRGEDLFEIVEGGPVLGEHNDPLVVPLALGEACLSDPVREPPRLRVGSAPPLVGHGPHLVQDRSGGIDVHGPGAHSRQQFLLAFGIDAVERVRGERQSLLLLFGHHLAVIRAVLHRGRCVAHHRLGDTAARRGV